MKRKFFQVNFGRISTESGFFLSETRRGLSLESQGGRPLYPEEAFSRPGFKTKRHDPDFLQREKSFFTGCKI
jgi:hypothetical protein